MVPRSQCPSKSPRDFPRGELKLNPNPAAGEIDPVLAWVETDDRPIRLCVAPSLLVQSTMDALATLPVHGSDGIDTLT